MQRSTYNFVQCCICVIYFTLCINGLPSELNAVCVFFSFIWFAYASWFGFLSIVVFFACSNQYCVSHAHSIKKKRRELDVSKRSNQRAYKVHTQCVAKEWVINKSYMFQYSWVQLLCNQQSSRINPLEIACWCGYSHGTFKVWCLLASSIVYWISNGISLLCAVHTVCTLQRRE